VRINSYKVTEGEGGKFLFWIPAFAGMTWEEREGDALCIPFSF